MSESGRHNPKLFPEFPPVPTEAWVELARQDLKGADYEKKLFWDTYEGIRIKPFYRSEDLQGLEYLQQAAPGEFPYVRGAKAGGNDWSIQQEVTGSTVAGANQTARNSLDRGADSVCFVIEPGEQGISGVPVQSVGDMVRLLDGIPLASTPVHFRAGSFALPVLAMFLKALENKGVDGATVRGSIDYDPISDLLTIGRSPLDRGAMLAQAVEVLRTAARVVPAFKPLAVRAALYHEAGGSAVQELAFALAAGTEYLNASAEAGLSVPHTAGRMRFHFAIGRGYFMEIAKLRAARLLWSRVQENFPGDGAAARPITIHARTALADKTIYDPFVNLLRGATEAMSAAIGGCDSMAVLPFDAAYTPSDEFGSHLARNTQLILKQESYFTKNADPAGGSYYVESLTDSLARAAWTLFQNVEARGGIVAAAAHGWIQGEVAGVAGKRRSAAAQRRDILLGTNQYPNLQETMSDKVDLAGSITPLPPSTRTLEPLAGIETAMQAFAAGASLSDAVAAMQSDTPALQIARLEPFRAAEEFEAIRLRTEAFATRTGRRPVVFLLTAGDLRMRQARAGFVWNFFGCAGFEVVENFGFTTVEEGVQAAAARKSDIVVLCSSDPEYPQLARQAAPLLKAALPGCALVVAGYPKEAVEELKAAGVDDFVHVKSNAIEVLRAYQDRLEM